jgi:aspartate racemase
MKTIGLIGGITWQSTMEYYRILNQETKKRLGGAHSAQILMYSFDWEEINGLRSSGHFDKVGIRLAEEAKKLELIGAELIMLGANTAHKFAEEVSDSISIPLIHIADVTGKAIQKQQLNKVLLLGTKYTMQEDFIKGKIKKDHNIEVLVPEPEALQEVSRIIFEELVNEKFLESSRNYLLGLIGKMRNDGIEGVILGCTELPLIIKPEDTSLPLFDTTMLHAQAAVEFANQ